MIVKCCVISSFLFGCYRQAPEVYKPAVDLAKEVVQKTEPQEKSLTQKPKVVSKKHSQSPARRVPAQTSVSDQTKVVVAEPSMMEEQKLVTKPMSQPEPVPVVVETVPELKKEELQKEVVKTLPDSFVPPVTPVERVDLNEERQELEKNKSVVVSLVKDVKELKITQTTEISGSENPPPKKASFVNEEPQNHELVHLSNVLLFVGSEFDQMDSIQKSNSTKASLKTQPTLNIALEWWQKWSDTVKTWLGWQSKSIEFSKPSSRDVEGAKMWYHTAQIGTQLYFSKRFGIIAQGQVTQLPFYYSRTTTSLSFESFTTTQLMAGPFFEILQHGPMSLELQTLYIYSAPGSTDNYSIDTGYGYYAGLHLKYSPSSFSVYGRAYYRSLKQDTSLLENQFTEIGLKLGVGWSF